MEGRFPLSLETSYVKNMNNNTIPTLVLPKKHLPDTEATRKQIRKQTTFQLGVCGWTCSESEVHRDSRRHKGTEAGNLRTSEVLRGEAFSGTSVHGD